METVDPSIEINSQIDLFPTQPSIPHPPPPVLSKEQESGIYAEKVKKLSKNKNDWLLVERKKKNIIPAVGTGAATGLEGVAPVKCYYWDIAPQRLNANTTTESTVKSHLVDKHTGERSPSLPVKKEMLSHSACQNCLERQRVRSKSQQLRPIHPSLQLDDKIQIGAKI